MSPKNSQLFVVEFSINISRNLPIILKNILGNQVIYSRNGTRCGGVTDFRSKLPLDSLLTFASRRLRAAQLRKKLKCRCRFMLCRCWKTRLSVSRWTRNASRYLQTYTQLIFFDVAIGPAGSLWSPWRRQETNSYPALTPTLECVCMRACFLTQWVTLPFTDYITAPPP